MKLPGHRLRGNDISISRPVPRPLFWKQSGHETSLLSYIVCYKTCTWMENYKEQSLISVCDWDQHTEIKQSAYFLQADQKIKSERQISHVLRRYGHQFAQWTSFGKKWSSNLAHKKPLDSSCKHFNVICWLLGSQWFNNQSDHHALFESLMHDYLLFGGHLHLLTDSSK